MTCVRVCMCVCVCVRDAPAQREWQSFTRCDVLIAVRRSNTEDLKGAWENNLINNKNISSVSKHSNLH